MRDVVVCLVWFVTNYVCVFVFISAFDYFGIETLVSWLVALCVLFSLIFYVCLFVFLHLCV